MTSMPLTPEAVQKQTFRSVRLRAGYDMVEVDQFLDEVEEELARLQMANEDLRSNEPAWPTTEAPAPAVGTVQDASAAAAQLLEIAANNADQLVDEAKAAADRIMHEARSRAERVDSETAERRSHLFADLERDRRNLERELEELRAFERAYRSRLKRYLESQLAGLEAQADTDVSLTPSADGETSGQLRQLLSDQPS